MLEGIGRFDHSQYGFCVVSLCMGKMYDRDFYAFVAVEPQNYPYFKKKYRSGCDTCFDAYGKELLRGWGVKPPEDIVDHVSRKYGIEFSAEPDFVARLVAITTNQSPFPLKPATAS